MTMFKGVSVGSWVHNLPNNNKELRCGYQNDPARPRLAATSPDANGNEQPWSMFQELRDLGVTHIKLWVSWWSLAQGLGRPPHTFMEQAQYMESSYGPSHPIHWQPEMQKPILDYLDENIRLANDNNIKVILAVEQNAPTWTHGAPGDEPGTNKLRQEHFPDALTVDSAYGWFIQYLLARYTGRVSAAGGPGCGCLPAHGNPLGAYIDYIEPLNEPNLEWWPQTPGTATNSSACRAATAWNTCEYLARFYAAYYPTGSVDGVGARPVVLGPSSSDKRNRETQTVNGVQYIENLEFEQFTRDVLSSIAEWQPQHPVRWAQHNYRDIELQETFAMSKAFELMNAYSFLRFAPQNSPRDVFLTEGSYRMGDWNEPANDPLLRDQLRGDKQRLQADRIWFNLGAASVSSSPPVRLWTLHVVNDDPGSNVMYGLREWREGSPRGPKAPRPAWHQFKRSI